MLKLLEKWPDQISQLGPQMAENLLQEEKKLQSQFPPEEQSCLNECRRILIAEVLPIITNSASLSSLQPKSFYKWFQKAIEFTTVYTTNSALVGRMGDKYKMSEPWERLKKLRQAIGKKCDWSEEKNCGSLLEQVKWVRLQKSRKQIFYTAGHLHLEATVRYMTLSEAQLIIPSDNESLSVFPMLNIFAKSKSIGGLRVEPLELKLGKSIELFDAASESYKILTSPGDKNIESCHKDWTHLEKRWKVTNWLWHRLIKDNAFDSAITSLSNLMKLPHFPPRLAVRCRAQLGCCYYGNKKIKSAVRPMLECLSLLYAKNPHIDDNECNLARPGRINWIKAKLSHLLPYTVHVVLQGLEEIVSSVDKDKQSKIYGWMLILSQHDWPQFHASMKYPMEQIYRGCTKSGFHYENFLDFVHEPSIIEELAWLSDMDVKMHVGENCALIEKTAFRQALIACIQRDDNLNMLLLRFLMSKKDEILQLMEMLKR